ncbi:MAG: ABC transporter substrate-binding protein [Candidatus Nanohaloarchaea archaeon]
MRLPLVHHKQFTPVSPSIHRSTLRLICLLLLTSRVNGGPMPTTRQHLILSVVVLGLVLGFTGNYLWVSISGNTPKNGLENATQSSDTPTVFATHDKGVATLFLWGIRKDKISLPKDVKLEPYTNPRLVTRSFTRNESDIAFVMLDDIDRILSNRTGVKILPYQLEYPPSISGVYALKNSTIDSKEDLRNKTIGYSRYSGVAPLALAVLKDSFGKKWSGELVKTSTRNAQKTLKKGEVDALWIIESGESVKKVYSPLSRLETEYGDFGFPALFIAKSGKVTEGIKTMESLQSSVALASENQEKVIFWAASGSPLTKEGYGYLGSILESGGNRTIRRISPGVIESFEYLREISEDSTSVQISDLIAER